MAFIRTFSSANPNCLQWQGTLSPFDGIPPRSFDPLTRSSIRFPDPVTQVTTGTFGQGSEGTLDDKAVLIGTIAYVRNPTLRTELKR
jgi:hypothetical protein